MEAIILAGGFGTRLKHIVSDVPKPMAPVNGRPFLRYILDDLTNKGVDRIVLAVGYLAQTIVTYFGDSYRGAELIYSTEDTPLFTGGAVKRALQYCREETVYIVNGDTYFDVNLPDMCAYLHEKRASFVIAAKPMENYDRYGTIAIADDGRIQAFKEKQHRDKGLINGGVYLMRRDFLDVVTVDTFSLETDVLEAAVHAERLYAYPCDGYFIDIGVPEDYARAQTAFPRDADVRKAAFFDRDGTINVDVCHLHRLEDLQFIDGMPEFIRKWNEWGYRVIVVTNQAGIAKGLYTADDMRRLHRYMNERLAAYGAHIDAFYFCPHHPDYTGPCHCRKPEPGMIERAIREYELDPKECILFGDQPWDVEAGKRAGVMGVRVSCETERIGRAQVDETN